MANKNAKKLAKQEAKAAKRAEKATRRAKSRKAEAESWALPLKMLDTPPAGGLVRRETLILALLVTELFRSSKFRVTCYSYG